MIGVISPLIFLTLAKGGLYFSVINHVTVIGLGTLGGFLAKHISWLENIKEITLIDFDLVERKNVQNSIYKYTQLGDYKTDALKEHLNEDVTITKIKERYIEEKTKLPRSDLVIDCRDIVCNRKKEIDVRFYISGKLLIIDCRRKVENQLCYPGSYRMILSKSEINKAAFYAAQIINSEQLPEMIKNETIQKIDLDLIPNLLNNGIKRTLKNKVDLIYDASDGFQQLHGLNDSIKPIIEMNQTDDVHVFFGSQKLNTKQKPHTITRKSLNTPLDAMLVLSKLVKETGSSSNFVVLINENNVVELIEETGAA